jgi:hypothetical protein
MPPRILHAVSGRLEYRPTLFQGVIGATEVARHAPPERIAADAQYDAASDARQEAIEYLLSTQPTTIAGVSAVLDYVNEPS